MHGIRSYCSNLNFLIPHIRCPPHYSHCVFMPALKACDENCQIDCYNAYASCYNAAKTDAAKTDAAKTTCEQTKLNCESKAAVALTEA
jgi:hypothetical protein